MTSAAALPARAAGGSPTCDASTRTWPWLAVLLCAGVAALSLAHIRLKAPVITNDGYQYLDGAASVVTDGCIITGVAEFDEEVLQGILPIKLTHFPPGYPLLIAGLSHLGVTRETAGYLISATGYLLSIWLMWDIGILLGGPPLLTFILTALWITNRESVLFASAVQTESLFIALFLGIVALVARDLKAEGGNPALLAAIGGLAGAAYWLRYAGLLLAPPALLYILWRWWRNRETLPWALAGVFAAFALVVPIQVRNIMYSGSWRGWVPGHVPQDWGYSLVRLIPVSYHIVLGDLSVIPLAIWVALSALAIVIMSRWGFRAWRRGDWSAPGSFLPLALAWIGVFVLCYVGGILAAGNNSLAPDVMRYNLPVYPLLLAGLAGAASLFPFDSLRLALVITATAVLGLQGLTFAAQPGHSPTQNDGGGSPGKRVPGAASSKLAPQSSAARNCDRIGTGPASSLPFATSRCFHLGAAGRIRTTFGRCGVLRAHVPLQSQIPPALSRYAASRKVISFSGGSYFRARARLAEVAYSDTRRSGVRM